MTFLSKSVPSTNKFTIPDIKIKNEDFVLGETSIGLGKCGDLAPLATIVTLSFKEAKLLLDGKKTWLGTRPKILEIGGVANFILDG